MMDAEELFRSIQNYLTPKLLKNKRLLITSGGTIEMIDDVRGITNLSSGNMGAAIANTAKSMGASVTLISSTQQIFSENINVIHTSDAHSMHQAVLKHINNQDIFISVAAVSDYKPKEIFKGKLKKDNLDMTLQLSPTIDILKEIGLSKNKIFKVGFAAESENLIENAQKKLKEKNLDLIVANLIHESMGREDTKISIIDKNNVIDVPKSNKMVAAKAILNEIAHRIHSDK
jgi:phosphopantothenoylcysteine decarboxylase/phosphopantothenate--cysteine ligase